ncbi:MAG: methyltransferase [Actinobacteria bacterium]|nr:methyltransferase [Actinomycetota bacterium]
MSTTPEIDDRAAAVLRGDLADASFTTDGLAALLGPVASAALERDEATPALVALEAAGPVPAATLALLWLLGRPVRRADLDRALPRTGTDGVVAAGLVEAAGRGDDDQVRALVDLQPSSTRTGGVDVDWWLASDPTELATGAPLRPDHVLGVGEASLTLLRATVPTRVGRALDLGTGCGIQALHVAGHAARVTATDLSVRALAYARFNAVLAGVELDLRAGSMLDPVEGERYDLVVSNPPFVITPRAAGLPEYEYRDGGRTGDALVRDLITGVGEVLAPGGVVQLLANWEVPGGQRWDERVGSWIDRSGLDGWVVQRDLVDPAQYVELWLRDGGSTRERDPGGWHHAYRAWLADFAARDVRAIGMGLVTLRRPLTEAPTLRRIEEITGTLDERLGQTIADVLTAHDLLQGLDDAAFAQVRLVVAADVTEERHLVPGETDPRVVLLRQGSGYRRAVQVGTAVAGFVGACDGELTAGTLVAALAAVLDRGSDEIAAEVLPIARDLVRDGLLRLV